VPENVTYASFAKTYTICIPGVTFLMSARPVRVRATRLHAFAVDRFPIGSWCKPRLRRHRSDTVRMYVLANSTVTEPIYLSLGLRKRPGLVVRRKGS
jgi:hypothetical protein